MIELLLVAALSGYAGYNLGQPGEPPKCEPNPLVRAQCTEMQAPVDNSFGATTFSLITLVGQYKKCRAAMQ